MLNANAVLDVLIKKLHYNIKYIESNPKFKRCYHLTVSRDVPTQRYTSFLDFLLNTILIDLTVNVTHAGWFN